MRCDTSKPIHSFIHSFVHSRWFALLPPLLFSFFSALWETTRQRQRQRHHTSLLHTHIYTQCAEPNTQYPPSPPPLSPQQTPFLSTSRTQTETTIMPAPALRPPRIDKCMPFLFLHAASDISPGRSVGRSVIRSEGEDGDVFVV